MDILEWLQTNIVAVISLATTIVLVVINIVYIYLTKKTLDVTVRQSNLAYNPVVGIRLGNMTIGRVFGPSRRNLGISLDITNVGNAPAIGVIVDAEIILQYSNVQGERVIPSRYEPFVLPFIRPGEDISNDRRLSPNFGNTCITHLLDDFRERKRLNILRIETDPTKESYEASRLRVILYYRNNLGQYFESVYETYLGLEEIPEDNKSAELFEVYIPRPKFHTAPIPKEKMDKEISFRNSKRHLCGW